MKMLLVSILIFAFSTLTISGQIAPDLTNAPLINERNGWIPYMVISPKYFGPNALPVTESNFAAVNESSEIELRAVNQNALGDQTNCIFARLNFILLPKVVSLEMSAMAYENYQMSIARRKYVNAWGGKGKGAATGDISINTSIQVVRNKTFPDVVVRLNFRTVGGGKLEDARYTDAPGYFFDATFGKDVNTNFMFLDKIRPYFSAGFYCWQNYDHVLMQNDAPMANAGINWHLKKCWINIEAAGYYGYKNNGDRPLLIRSNLNYNSKKINYKIGFEKGLHDYDYTNFYVGFALHFNIAKYLKGLSEEENPN